MRKQVHELQAADFEAHACWEYATDEEGRDDQDECTVRPFPLEQLAGATHQVFVQAAFFFPNGRIRLGVVTLNAGADPSGHQPALFAPDGLMTFYEGAAQPEQFMVRRFVESLEKISPTPLPVNYVSALSESDGQPLAAGTLDGLYWLVNWETGEVRAET
jgi:hypothetical protein